MARRRIYRRRRQVVGGGLLLCCVLVVLAGFRLAGVLSNGPVAAADAPPATVTAPKAGSTSAPSRSPGLTAPVPKPARPTGEYVRAPGGTGRHGSGTLVTYIVEVETGAGQGAPAFAAAVDATLADPRGWTGQGRWSLQRVTTSDANLVIRLATAATVDKVCATVGLNTRGYVSCRAGNFVMINLDRWLQAVPDYRGDVALYQRYVINHEVGHRLGYGHQACPGQGRLAPVMQQQTFGLKGCLANGWPYVAGELIAGPAAS